MKNKSKIFIVLLVLILCFLISSCNNSDNISDNNINPIDTITKVTFIELGSVSCIPCQNMRPVMDSIQKKYGSQILVKFIDVIKNREEAEQYKIRLMPTQVFLDSANIEFYRHEGFFSEDSIHILLQSRGLICK
ncbi:MAG: hypothetical protein A2X61_01000 [Ignavibacteria bacterium GWB2_35_12]|nr:MAG: hypothetical protein A2X63_01470 [Ignavibacteria bacterium GWA2_35_8]OGU39057.1 MAG: hypothetical protein A2X61_01000 [Ignavibacteria bacterium GWB2_35_12]OGU87904.1 MAG: hypothetical protein A2220_10325 [Ignavibacteria bacterium RIFOXYA2_FULL_35_10]OGV21766.1 MAG: hypothetical protein A2475_04225 [Ignavibacteria bacterium RIFOXYC2_FULL_35_21]